MKQYRQVRLFDAVNDDLNSLVEEVLEKRKQERELAPPAILQDRTTNDVSFDEPSVFDNDEGFSEDVEPSEE
jgi:hypothetical protein